MFGLSRIEIEILDHLKSGTAMYGLELVKASDILKRGSIYVYLQRMEDKGWVSSKAEKIETVSGMPRRKYVITGVGAKVLRGHYDAQANAVWHGKESVV